MAAASKKWSKTKNQVYDEKRRRNRRWRDRRRRKSRRKRSKRRRRVDWIGKPRPVKPAGLPSCYYADVDVPSNQNYAMLTTPGPCSTLLRAMQSVTTIVQSHPREQWTNLHITVHWALEMCSRWWCSLHCNKSLRWVFWNCCYHGGAPWWAMIRPLDTFARFRSSSLLISTFFLSISI